MHVDLAALKASPEKISVEHETERALAFELLMFSDIIEVRPPQVAPLAWFYDALVVRVKSIDVYNLRLDSWQHPFNTSAAPSFSAATVFTTISYEVVPLALPMDWFQEKMQKKAPTSCGRPRVFFFFQQAWRFHVDPAALPLVLLACSNRCAWPTLVSAASVTTFTPSPRSLRTLSPTAEFLVRMSRTAGCCFVKQRVSPCGSASISWA